MSTYEIHPAAELFPMMSDAELSELADDIKENGLLEPVVIHDGKVLDGRNRLRACEIAGVEPRFENPSNPVGSLVIYVLSKNLHRRHLTVSQRGAIAAEVVPLMAEEAQRRQVSHLKNQPCASLAQIGTDDITGGRSSEIAAKALSVSRRTVTRAIAVKRENPQAFERVKRGEITVNEAAGEQEKRRSRKSGAPKHGGHQPKSIDTKRGKIVAEAQKRKMIDGLSLVSGVCHGLQSINAAMIEAVCDGDELEIWASKAEGHSRDLRKFANRLRGANGKPESSKDGTGESGQLGDTSEGAENAEPQLSQAAN